ncbi:chymotrypsinogen B-like [Ixodes scapularis]|uniref:chymotrypsinogen B-like n=1 Tax=Ixodes scapularis TaxID=6945 RepID=UPI001A9E6A1B|nr:chymotrypsinogen B-like [Ixodes scapularis]
MIWRDLAVLTVSSILLGVASMEHTEDNDLLQNDNCGRRHLKNTVSERIVNGTMADPASWPWMVGLYNGNDTFYCGGVLISNQFVLTAAHCFRNENASFISVRMGSVNRINYADCSGETTGPLTAEGSDELDGNTAPNSHVVCVGVEQVCVPIQNCSFFMGDIALLKLKRPVNFTNYIQPICLPENLDMPSSIVPIFILGWGFYYDTVVIDYSGYEDMEETGSSSSELVISVTSGIPLTLRQRNITLINKTACEKQLKKMVPGYILCSTGGGCHGDSGGPLVYENNGTWFLFGIHSGGDQDCYNPKGPGMHIDVSYYVSSFIKPFMKLGNNTEGGKHICATYEDHIQCVAQLYAS